MKIPGGHYEFPLRVFCDSRDSMSTRSRGNLQPQPGTPCTPQPNNWTRARRSKGKKNTVPLLVQSTSNRLHGPCLLHKFQHVLANQSCEAECRRLNPKWNHEHMSYSGPASGNLVYCPANSLMMSKSGRHLSRVQLSRDKHMLAAG